MYEDGRRMVMRSMGVLRDLPGRETGRPRRHLLRVPIAVIAVALVFPGLAEAGQGWWWGPPSNPGFDQNTVIQVTGRAIQMDLAPRGGPATLRLETPRETYTVMLGPGWYLAQAQWDLRVGDPITVEGSKMMDPWGNLHLVAARVTNQRTGSVLVLRDEKGRPRWMGGRPQG